MYYFKATPFLKIISPYILGIVSVFGLGVMPNIYAILPFVFLFLISIFFFNRKRKVKYIKIVYIITVNVFLFGLAHLSFYVCNAKNYKSHYTRHVSSYNQQVIAQVAEVPVHNDKGLKLVVNVVCLKTNTSWNYVTGKSIVYLKTDLTKTYNVGDYLYLNNKWAYVASAKNPNQFNYKTYLEQRNIYSIIYTNRVSLLNNACFKNQDSYFLLGEKIKSHIVNTLRQSNLTDNAFAISTALLVGFDDEIDKATLSSFSHSGTLHILSVSGMHTGVIYAIIVFLFSVVDKNNNRKKTKCAVVLITMLVFTAITGFSPSVVRASLMLSLIIIGNTFQKQNNNYNTLLLSAFILLLINPYLILDVGFLLSYFAVFGIMFLYPKLSKLVAINNKIIKWFWDSVLISFSATLFTLPITLYFFHQFPIWFIISNVVIIPLSLIIMASTLLILLFIKVLMVKTFFVKITNLLVGLMISTSNITNNNIFGYIDYISFQKIDVLFLSLAICLFLNVIIHKNYRIVMAFLFLCIIWCSYSIFENHNQLKQSEIVVFHIKQKSFFITRIGNKLFYTKNNLTPLEFEQNIKPYILQFSNAQLIDTNYNYIALNNFSFYNLNGKELEVNKANNVLISNNSYFNFDKFKKHNPLIIADGSNNNRYIVTLRKECAKLNIPFYNIKEQGAITIKTN